MQTLKETFGTRTNLSTSGAGLGSVVRTNLDYANPLPFSFVFDKFLKLKETPAIQPEVKPLTFPNISYSFKVLQYNSSSVAICNNPFADGMIPVSLETPLSAGNLFEQFLGRTSAFALESCPQTLEFEPVSFNLITAKELPIARYSNMVYSDINTNLKSVRNLVDADVSGKSDVKEEPALFVNSQKSSLVTPIQIFKVIFWNLNRDINPFFKSRKLDFIFAESKCSLVEGKRHKLFENRFASFVSLNRFKSLRCYSIGIYDKLRGQFKAFSCLIIAKMMQFVSVAYLGFKSFISNILNSFRVLLHGFKKQIIFRYLYFNSSYRLHKLNVGQLIYKYYAQMSSGGWQFLPLLKQGVSLPYELWMH